MNQNAELTHRQLQLLDMCEAAVRAELWDTLVRALTSMSFLECKVEERLVDELAGDYRRAIEALPWGHLGRKILPVLEQALLRDSQFIRQNPGICSNACGIHAGGPTRLKAGSITTA